MEGAAKQADDSLTVILDSSPMGVAISDSDDSSILYLNEAMADFLELARELAIGRPTTFFFDPEDRRKVLDALAEFGEIRKFTVRNRSARGIKRSSIFSCRLITYGGHAAILTWLEDETERRQREEEILSASRQVELLHQIAGISNRAVNFYDALRKGSAEIARCLGWPVSVVYRRTQPEEQLLQLSSLSLPKDNSDYEFLRTALVGRSFASGEDLPGRVLAARVLMWIEDVTRDPDITRFSSNDPVQIVSALGIPIVDDDFVVAVVELLTDRRSPPDERLALTLSQVGAELGRVHLRDQMTVALQEARAEAESSSRAKASFLAAMSHEVRTPMNGVVGMVDLVLGTQLDDEQRFMLQTVKDSGEALIKVINDILDFSKIEAGRMEIEEAPFSVTKTVETVALSIAPLAAKKKLTLITYIDPHIPEMVIGDAVRVRQILSNLGANAVKFSTAGEIVIKAEFASADDRTRVRFSVRDEGIGIATEDLGRLFEEFQQADTSTTRRFGGTGLGLAICQRLTRLMGGTIGADSLVGVGSEFHCELPFGEAERRATARKSANLAGLRVLVVAESAELRQACGSYLRFWEADVAEAARPREAISSLRASHKDGKPVDVVVLPQPSGTLQVSALRQGIAELRLTPRGPRLVVGRDPQSEVGNIGAEVTVLDINPVRRAALITAVAVAAGRASPETTIIEQPDVTSDVKAPTVEEALKQGRLILVAEDHIANQEVLRRQLNRLGYACEIAEDGAIALKMWHTKKYALLLTDCHMPNMDGFGLTTEVRKSEQGTGRHAPIIAITANVLQGEAERCLAAGMDAFLPKPVELATLRNTLGKWIDGKPEIAGAAVPPQRPTADQQPSVLDLTLMREAFGEIDDGVREFFGIFIDSVQPLISKFEEELSSARYADSRETIHKAKGATANVGGRELAAVMHAIEVALVEQKFEEAHRHSLQLRPAWDRLIQAIAAA